MVEEDSVTVEDEEDLVTGDEEGSEEEEVRVSSV